MDILITILAIMILFFLPGYTFINMLFPKKGELDVEYDYVARIALGMAMSVVISILVGYVLGFFGLLYPNYLWVAFVNLTLIFFLIGFYRGGYPTIRKLLGLEEEDKYDRLIRLNDLLKERKKLIKRLEELEKIIKIKGHRNKEPYEEEREKILKDIGDIDEEIEKLKGVLDEI